MNIESDAHALRVRVQQQGQMPSRQRDVRLSIPAAETRGIDCIDCALIDSSIADGWRHLHLCLDI
ncbi:hypothetical protein [Candidatus Burkholderia verschuerenii]|uniref:hypothetical protein n=1 Tax=Candidatus Burkholderia verschuerenii TaxID=242163 RepID=UPI00067CA15A|nr:hypothetical protein [Candidatus Burkholderia verschuerenii]